MHRQFWLRKDEGVHVYGPNLDNDVDYIVRELKGSIKHRWVRIEVRGDPLVNEIVLDDFTEEFPIGDGLDIRVGKSKSEKHANLHFRSENRFYSRVEKYEKDIK
jgi:hypothetical protein